MDWSSECSSHLVTKNIYTKNQTWLAKISVFTVQSSHKWKWHLLKACLKSFVILKMKDPLPSSHSFLLLLFRGCIWFAFTHFTPGTPMETTCIWVMTKTCAWCPGCKSSSEYFPGACKSSCSPSLTWRCIFHPPCSKFDLYTKTTDLPDVEKLKPYYQSLMDKYCPGILKWWRRQQEVHLCRWCTNFNYHSLFLSLEIDQFPDFKIIICVIINIKLSQLSSKTNPKKWLSLCFT